MMRVDGRLDVQTSDSHGTAHIPKNLLTSAQSPI